MNKSILLKSIIFLALAIAGGAVFYHLKTVDSISKQQNALAEPSQTAPPDYPWKDEIGKISHYVREDKSAALQKDKAKEKQEAALVDTSDGVHKTNSPRDATLVAIKMGESSSVLYLFKDAHSTLSFKVGEQWMNSWVVKEIYQDYVVWFQSTTNEEFMHYLFQQNQASTPLAKI